MGKQFSKYTLTASPQQPDIPNDWTSFLLRANLTYSAPYYSNPPTLFLNGEAVNIHLYSGYNSSKKRLFWKTAAVWARLVCSFLELLGSQEGQRNLQGWLRPCRTLVQCPRIGSSGQLMGKHTSGLILLLISAFMWTTSLSLCLFVAFISHFVSDRELWARRDVATRRHHMQRRPIY